MARSKGSASGRPLLLPLVYVATLTLVGVSCAALAVQQALDELREVAGTQLDPELVALFVDGIEHDPDAPMPGADRSGTQL